MAQTQFHYVIPILDSTSQQKPCRDATINDIAPLDDDEIVIFGDSFSAQYDRIWPNCRWHQFMGGLLGKRTVSVVNNFRPVEEYLSALKKCPGTLGDTVIIESVERELIGRLCYINFDNIYEPTSVTTEPNSPGPLRGKWRSIKTKPLEYYQRHLGFDRLVLTKNIDKPLFSSHERKLYFYTGDTVIQSDWEIATAAKNLKILDSLSKAYGITLVFVAIPNKLTAYRNHVIGNQTPFSILESPCYFDNLPCFINTLPVIDSLIKEGVVDVYLPDDTHFSAPTAKAIGEYVARRLTSQP